MSATITGPIVLENPTNVEGSSRTIEFDGQIWLTTATVLNGKFRYFNSWNLTFDSINYFIAWIHITKVVPIIDQDDPDMQVSTEQDDAAERESSSVTLADDYHIYGDIVYLIKSTRAAMRNTPYGFFSGAVSESNKKDNTFELNISQYTTFYKTQRHLSTLPIRVHFDDIKWKTKKPLPSNNSYVAIEGYITRFELDPATGFLSMLHLILDNISFLGKAVIPAIGQAIAPAPTATPRPSRFKFSFDDDDEPTESKENETSKDTPKDTQQSPSRGDSSNKRQSKRSRAE